MDASVAHFPCVSGSTRHLGNSSRRTSVLYDCQQLEHMRHRLPDEPMASVAAKQ